MTRAETERIVSHMPHFAGYTYRIDAFKYDSDLHCLACAISRFGLSALSPYATTLDSEGSAVMAVYEFEERPAYVRCCGTCGEYIDNSEDFHAVQLIALKDRGFDSSYATAEGVRPRCSRCDAICINGVACHERGCTNAAQDDDCEESES